MGSNDRLRRRAIRLNEVAFGSRPAKERRRRMPTAVLKGGAQIDAEPPREAVDLT
jgi:hypothetical protein